MKLLFPFILPLITTKAGMVAPGLNEPPHPLKATSAQAAVVMDSLTGKMLWSRDPETPRPPASTTKIMTTLLLLENYKPTDIITAPADVTKVKESSMNLKPYEKVSVRDMAYALMLRSANDGCYAVAVQTDGSVEAFAKRMNERAAEIGCQGTSFRNPNGLNNPAHLTSAHDLALIAREAMKRADFQEVAHTKRKAIKRSSDSKDLVMVSRNKWLFKDPTADGIKTGWTIPSGHTYVGSATRNGMRVITSLMDSPKWQDDHKAMLNWAFKTYERSIFKRAGTVDTMDLGSGVPSEIKCLLETKQDIVLCVPKADDSVTVKFEPNLKANRPYHSGDLVGNVVITDVDKFEIKAPIHAATSEPALSVAQKAQAATMNPAGLLIVGVLGAGTLIVRGKARSQTK